MNQAAKTTSLYLTVRTLMIDSLAITFVILVPAWSHLLPIPLYYLEPMRIVLMLVLLFTSRFNSLLLAISLPVLSFLVSGHPDFVKMMIICAELALNALLFLKLIKISGKPFESCLFSILLSKLFCYIIYWIVFSWDFVMRESDTEFMFAQIILSLLISLMVWGICKIQPS